METLRRDIVVPNYSVLPADYVLDLSTGSKNDFDRRTPPQIIDSPPRESSPHVDTTTYNHRMSPPHIRYETINRSYQEQSAIKSSEYCLPLRGSPVHENQAGKISPVCEADSGYSLSPRSYKGESDGSISPPPSSLVQKVLDAPSSATRPFKAYPRNPLALGHDEAFIQFREQMLSKVRSLNRSSSASKARTQNNGCDDKDAAYWERRRKNNEAAKRSRDARRAKEDEIAIRAAFLEQENLRLKYELASLKDETCKLRSMVYNNNPPELLHMSQIHALHPINHMQRI